jgi:hypothetical protein
MIVKIHKNPEGQVILAICDSSIIGKEFTQDDLQLDLTSEFYKGEEKSEAELLELIKDAYIINAVGKECIDFLLKHNLIDKENIITIDNIPHAQCVIIRE